MISNHNFYENGCTDEALDLAFWNLGSKLNTHIENMYMLIRMRLQHRLLDFEINNPFTVFIDLQMEEARKMIKKGPCYVMLHPNVFDQVKHLQAKNVIFYSDSSLPEGKCIVVSQPKFDLSPLNLYQDGSDI